MSHTYEKLSSNKAKLTIVVPAEQFDEAMNKAYLKMRGRINVPGFRKGKAPRKLIETMYGEGVFYDDALDIIFPEVYPAAIEAEGLKPVDRPEVNVEEIGQGKDLKFTCEVFVRPDVELGQYKGLEVEVEQQVVTDDMVDTRIKQDQQKASRTVDVEERAVATGDTVKLDYAGTVDGVAFEGGTAKDQTLVIGSGSFIPGFEEQLVGASAGDSVDVNVTFPQNYHAENLAGKPVVFKCKVHQVQEKKLPELNDLFAKRYHAPNMDTLRENIRQSMTQQKQQQANAQAQQAILDQVVANAQIELTDAFTEAFVNQLFASFTQNLMAQNITLEQFLQYQGISEDDLKSQMQPQAEAAAKASAALETIAELEGLSVTEEEIDADIRRMANMYGMPYEDLAKDLTPDKREMIQNGMLMTKTLAFLMDASVEE